MLREKQQEAMPDQRGHKHGAGGLRALAQADVMEPSKAPKAKAATRYPRAVWSS